MEQVSLDTNGKKTQVSTGKNWILLSVLREVLGLTGVKCGCSIGDCGACEITIDGEAVNSYLMLTRNLEGKKIETIEDLPNSTDLHPIQQAFIDAKAVWYGYCTPGTVMSARVLLDRIEDPTGEEIRNSGVSNNLCRCMGYVKTVEAIRLVARRMTEVEAGGKKKEH